MTMKSQLALSQRCTCKIHWSLPLLHIKSSHMPLSSSHFMINVRGIYTDASSSSTLTRCYNSPIAPFKKLQYVFSLGSF